jgi:hypothetical protein
VRSHARFGPLMISLVVGGLLSGCFSSTKEVETVPAPVVQAPPPVVQEPPGLSPCRYRIDELVSARKEGRHETSTV